MAEMNENEREMHKHVLAGLNWFQRGVIYFSSIVTSSGNFIRVQVREEKRRQASSRRSKNVGIKGLLSFFL